MRHESPATTHRLNGPFASFEELKAATDEMIENARQSRELDEAADDRRPR
jgi:hypothetical protein